MAGVEWYANINGLWVSLEPDRSLQLLSEDLYVIVPGGLRLPTDPKDWRRFVRPRRERKPYLYHYIEVWMWDNREHLAEVAAKDRSLPWRTVAVRAGVPDIGTILTDWARYTVDRAAAFGMFPFPRRQ